MTPFRTGCALVALIIATPALAQTGAPAPSDADLAALVRAQAAEIAALLPTLAHLTGDLGLLREELRPDQLLLMQDDGGLLPDVAAQAREAALEALIRHRDAGAPPAPAGRWRRGGRRPPPRRSAAAAAPGVPDRRGSRRARPAG